MSKTAALFAVAGLAAACHASDINWINSSGGPFGTASNWSPAQVPSTGDRAIFNRGSTSYTVTFGLGRSNAGLEVQQDTVALNLQGATYVLTSAASLSVGGGTRIFHGRPEGVVGDLRLENSGPGAGSVVCTNSYIGGNSATRLLGSGNVNVYGNVAWQHSGLLLVGGGATGTLNVLGTGDVTSGTGLVGQTAPGTATVDASGSSWTVSSILDLGGNSNGTLNVTNGGLVHDGTGRLGLSAGVTGAVVVSGMGSGGGSSLWETSGAVTLGMAGTGTLTVSGGGHVTSAPGAGSCVLASGAGSHATVSISGTGSRWINSGGLVMGAGGAAGVTIGAGGILDSSGDTSVGSSASGSGTVSVSGAGATWNARNFFVGGSGSGAGGAATVNIGVGGSMNTLANGGLFLWGPGTVNLDGGTLTLGDLNLTGGTLNWNSGTVHFLNELFVMPGAPLGPNPSIGPGRTLHAGLGIDIDATTNPTLTMAGGLIASDSTIFIADSTRGTLNVSSGGMVSTPDLSIGTSAGSSGLLHLDGTGTTWSLGTPGNFDDVYIGQRGAGELRITGGASMIVNHNPVDLGNDPGSQGTVLVSGQDSSLELLDYFVSVGRSGSGTVNIDSGGQIVGDATVAEVAGSGTVNISGAGSVWHSHVFTLGHAGPGVMTVSGGGTLDAGDCALADGMGSNATLDVSGAGSAVTATSGNGAFGELIVGGASTASMTVENGGHASAHEVFVGDGQPAVGTLTVRGGGSSLSSQTGLSAGYNGTGTIQVMSGATAAAADASIGERAGSHGLVMVDGAGSALTLSGAATVGGGASGRLEIANSGSVHATGPMTVNGTGTVAMTSGGLSAAYIAVNGGTLQGSGSITGDLNNGGSVAPGDSGGGTGLLSVQGAYAQTATGTLNIEIGGTSPVSQFDRLAVSGAATVGGTLNVSFVNGYVPRGTETFAFLTASSISGAFANVHFPALSGGGLRVVYGPNSVSVAFCYANCDGSAAAPTLNVNDFICFQAKFAAGDPYANCDGSTLPPVLNVNDFICFQTRFASGCP